MGSGAWEGVLGFPESFLRTCWLLCARHWALCFPSSLMRTWCQEGVLGVCRAVVCDLGRWTEGWVSQGLDVSTSIVGSRVPVFLQVPCSPDPFSSFLAQGSGPPSGAPVLVLRFSYICPDRQLRCYAVLEPEAHEAIQVMESRGRWKGGGSSFGLEA